jgi:hypothetical protein
MKQLKFTSGELRLLIDAYNNNGKLTFNEQTIYENKNSFYISMGNLSRHEFISKKYIITDSRRLCIYELTFKGLKLIELIT